MAILGPGDLAPDITLRDLEGQTQVAVSVAGAAGAAGADGAVAGAAPREISPWDRPAGLAAAAGSPGEKRPTVLVFMKSSCPTCQFLAPFVEILRAGLPAGAARFLGIMQDEREEALNFRDMLGLRFPLLLEPEPWESSERYGLESVPATFLVEPDGRISRSFLAFQRPEIESMAQDLASRAGGSSVELFGGREVPILKPG